MKNLDLEVEVASMISDEIGDRWHHSPQNLPTLSHWRWMGDNAATFVTDDGRTVLVSVKVSGVEGATDPRD